MQIRGYVNKNMTMQIQWNPWLLTAEPNVDEIYTHTYTMQYDFLDANYRFKTCVFHAPIQYSFTSFAIILIHLFIIMKRGHIEIDPQILFFTPIIIIVPFWWQQKKKITNSQRVFSLLI